MDRAKAKRKLKRLQKRDDTETAHVEADAVLCALLSQLGYDDVVAEYNLVPKWFA